VTRVKAVLAEHQADLERLEVEVLALFGSAARGEERPDSDLDFLVRFRGPATFAQYTDLRFMLEDLLGRPVDLVTWKGIRPEIRDRVEREAVRVA
jgi:uncharacterized protein